MPGREEQKGSSPLWAEQKRAEKCAWVGGNAGNLERWAWQRNEVRIPLPGGCVAMNSEREPQGGQ